MKRLVQVSMIELAAAFGFTVYKLVAEARGA
jgi:hypothetical protein